MSLIATSSSAGSSSTSLRVARPIRPRPLIATRAVMALPSSMAGVRPACGPGTPGQPRAEAVPACGSWPTGRLAFVPRTQRRRVRTVPTPGPSGLAGLRARLARWIAGAASPPESRDQDQKRDHGEGADPDPPPTLAEDD